MSQTDPPAAAIATPDADLLQKTAAKAEKCRLLDAELTVALCVDTREAGCAKAREMQASWKHLKRRAKALRKDRGVRVTAIPTKCVDVCKGGPLMTVQPGGHWYAACTPEAIDAILDAHLDGSGPLESHALQTGRS